MRMAPKWTVNRTKHSPPNGNGPQMVKETYKCMSPTQNFSGQTNSGLAIGLGTTQALQKYWRDKLLVW